MKHDGGEWWVKKGQFYRDVIIEQPPECNRKQNISET